MPLPRLLRTATFRLSALYAILFGACVLLLGAAAFWSTRSALEKQLTRRIEGEMTLLEQEYRGKGIDGLVSTVQQRSRVKGNLDYFVVDPAGNRRLTESRTGGGLGIGPTARTCELPGRHPESRGTDGPLGRRAADRHRRPADRRRLGARWAPWRSQSTGCGRARAWRPRTAVRAEMGAICFGPPGAAASRKRDFVLVRISPIGRLRYQHGDLHQISRKEFAALPANSHRNNVRFLGGVCGELWSCEGDPAPFASIYPAHPCPYTENPRAFHLERALILHGFSI